MILRLALMKRPLLQIELRVTVTGSNVIHVITRHSKFLGLIIKIVRVYIKKLMF